MTPVPLDSSFRPEMGGFIVRRSSSQFRPNVPDPASEIDKTDDSGSGLYEACIAHFAPPEYAVECDARHTVWVKRTDGSRSYGLPPWSLRRNTLDEVMERVQGKLEAPVVKH